MDKPRDEALAWLAHSQSLLTNVRWWINHGRVETATEAIDDYMDDWRNAAPTTEDAEVEDKLECEELNLDTPIAVETPTVEPAPFVLDNAIDRPAQSKPSKRYGAKGKGGAIQWTKDPVLFAAKTLAAIVHRKNKEVTIDHVGLMVMKLLPDIAQYVWNTQQRVVTAHKIGDRADKSVRYKSEDPRLLTPAIYTKIEELYRHNAFPMSMWDLAKELV